MSHGRYLYDKFCRLLLFESLNNLCRPLVGLHLGIPEFGQDGGGNIRLPL
jgi:hypothetical protein